MKIKQIAIWCLITIVAGAVCYMVGYHIKDKEYEKKYENNINQAQIEMIEFEMNKLAHFAASKFYNEYYIYLGDGSFYKTNHEAYGNIYPYALCFKHLNRMRDSLEMSIRIRKRNLENNDIFIFDNPAAMDNFYKAVYQIADSIYLAQHGMDTLAYNEKRRIGHEGIRRKKAASEITGSTPLIDLLDIDTVPCRFEFFPASDISEYKYGIKIKYTNMGGAIVKKSH